MNSMKPMKDVLYIVVHCSCTRASQTVTVEDIDRMHKAKGYNEHAIGVCYVGGKDEKGRNADTRTPEQKAALWFLLKDLKESYPNAKIVGHRDFPNVHKDCPCYDVQSEMAELNSPTLNH